MNDELVNAIQTVDTSNLIREADYNTNIDEIEKKIPYYRKYIITPEFNNLTAEHFAERLKEVKLANKSDNANL